MLAAFRSGGASTDMIDVAELPAEALLARMTDVQIDKAIATVGTAQVGSLGTILVDSQGRTLYLFQKDSGTNSACSGACATAWPPLRDSGKPTAGTGLNASLLGTTPRSDGNPQVTYNGHPLYTFVMDQKPGDAKGQGVTAFGASWFTLNSAGNQVTAAEPATTTSGSSGGGGYGY